MFHAAGNTLGRLYSCLYAALSLFAANRILAALRPACLILLLNGVAVAQTYTWIGGAGVNNNWGNSFNWQNGLIPPTNGVNTSVIMRGSGLVSTVADFFGNNVNWHIRNLTFHSLATEGFTLDGGALIVAEYIRNENHHVNTFALPVRFGTTSLTIDAVDGDLNFFDRVRFTQDDSLLTIRGGNSVFFGSDLTRDAAVTKAQVTIANDTQVSIAGNTTGVNHWNIHDGTLQLQTAASFRADATIHVGSSGRLNLRGIDVEIGELTGIGPVTTGSDSTGFGRLTVGNSNDFTYSGIIHGHVTKIGSGTLTLAGGILSGPSLYSTIIEEGTLRLEEFGILGSSGIIVTLGATLDLNGRDHTFQSLLGEGTVRLGGATLTLNHSGLQVASSRIEGPGMVAKSGSGTLSLSNTNNAFSTLQLNAGSVEVNNSGALGSGDVVIGDATLRTTATMTSARPISLSSSASKISVDSQRTFTQNAVISGSGELNKLGAGTLVLGANNTYSGTTTISAGTLRLSSSNRIGDASDVVVSSGAVFELSNTGNETVASLSGAGTVDTRTSARLTVIAASGTTTFAGDIVGGGGINKQGGHTLILTGNNTYTGATNITGGTLQGSVGNSSLVTVGTGAIWHLNGMSQAVGSITGGGAINVQGASLVLLEESSATRTFSGNISGIGGLDKRGTHTLVLSGNNSYLTTGIKGGVLRVASSDNLGDGGIVFGGGTLHTTGSFTISNSVVVEGGTPAFFDVDPSTTLTLTGPVIGAAGSLAKTGGGMLTLSGNNTFSGELYLQEGMLSVSASNHLGDASVPILFFGGTLRTTASFENARSATIGPFNSGTFYVAGPTTFTQSGPVHGGTETTLIKDGGGVLRLTGSLDATFGGAVTINEGALELFHNAGASFGGDISGDGSLRKGGTGVYTLSGNLTYGGETRVEAGTLRRDGGSGLPNTTDLHVAVGAVYDLNNQSDTINALTGEGSVTLGSAVTPKTLTIGSAGGSGTFSGVISGTFGHLAKTGAGTQVLTGNNTYAQTFFNGGVLSTGASANLGSSTLNFNGGTWEVTGSLTNSRQISIGIGSSGTIDVNAGVTLTQTGTISGSLATLNKAGAGTLLLTSSAAATTVNVNAGVLRLDGGNGLAAGAAVTVASGATWDLNGLSDAVATIAGAGALQLNGGAQLTVGGNTGSTVFSGVLSGNGALLKAGSHQLTLSGANTYSGGTAIKAGVLAISSNANLGSAAAPVSFDGGTLRTSGTISTNRNVTMNAGGGTFEVTAGGTLNVNGSLSGAGSLTKTGSGALALNGNAPAYAGPINLANGALLVNANVSSAPITVDAPSTLGGAGSVGTIVNQGRVSPGSRPAAAGSLDVAGDFTQHTGGTLEIELAGTTGGTQYDQLPVAGIASLSGTLAVSLLDGFLPAAGDVFEIITAARGITGTFVDTTLPTLAGSLAWNIDYGATSVTLAVAAPGLPGDFNGNGAVDAADYVLWRKTDGPQEDYDLWRANFGRTAGAGAGTANASVPEPASLVLLPLSVVAGMMMPRRR